MIFMATGTILFDRVGNRHLRQLFSRSSLLKRLPEDRFDMPLWKEAKAHPDHHVVFDKNYYSVPTRYVGKKVWVRGGLQNVQIFHDGEMIKTHVRSYGEGVWRTDETDYPPHKSRYLRLSVFPQLN